jgi:hypothetical protein
VHQDPPPPSRYAALSPAIDAVIMRGLSKQPADRFPDVLAFVEALTAAVQSAALQAFEAEEPPPIRPYDAPRPVPPEPPPVEEPGRQTMRLIRKVRRRIHRGPSRLALIAVAATAAVAYFSPTARVHGVDAWHRAHSEAERLLARAAR